MPGEYDTYLNAYKDGERIYSDTLKVCLENKKDFLKYNWSEITKSDKEFYCYNNALRPEATLYSLNRYANLMPSVEVMAMSDDHGKNFATVKDLLYTLYGEPTYDSNIHIYDQFEELFSANNSHANDYPLSIWVTEKANIALMQGREAEWFRYFIYAETATAKGE